MKEKQPYEKPKMTFVENQLNNLGLIEPSVRHG